ncbi:MAG: hypothetical protein AB8F95_13200 [Bacteroidia bacterium]
MMHKLLHITLAFLLVWSTSGIQLVKHYCMGSLKQSGWYASKTCGHSEKAKPQSDKPSAHPFSLSAIPCCEDETTWLQTEEPFVITKSATLTTPPFLVATESPIRLFEAQNISLSNLDRGPPPEDNLNRTVVFQVFRI